jgi:hypothetical protein
MGGIYKVGCWDELSCYDTYTKLHNDSFRHFEVIKEDYIDTNGGTGTMLQTGRSRFRFLMR